MTTQIKKNKLTESQALHAHNIICDYMQKLCDKPRKNDFERFDANAKEIQKVAELQAALIQYRT